MRELPVLAIHLLVTLATLVRPGGVRAIAAESLMLKHQLLISNRSRQRAPNPITLDRCVLGLTTLLVSCRRILKLRALISPQRCYMSAFLAQASAKHRSEFIVMVVDGASSHLCKELVVPRNIRLLRLPPYALELNPQEHVWDELREKEFPNRVFSNISSVVEQLRAGLPCLSKNRKGLRSLTCWPWIIRLDLNAR